MPSARSSTCLLIPGSRDACSRLNAARDHEDVTEAALLVHKSHLGGLVSNHYTPALRLCHTVCALKLRGRPLAGTRHLAQAPGGTLPGDFETFWMTDLWETVASKPLNALWMTGEALSCILDPGYLGVLNACACCCNYCPADSSSRRLPAALTPSTFLLLLSCCRDS